MPDRKDYAPGPTRMARMCEDRIVGLLAERKTAAGDQCKDINEWLHMVRDMLKWDKTRAGYQQGQA